MFIALGIILMAAPSAPSPAPAPLVLGDGKLRIRDLAEKTLDGDVPGGDLVVASLPEGPARITLGEGQRLALLRRRLPGAALVLRHSGDVAFVRGAAAKAGTDGGNCLAARADIPAGHYLGRDDVIVAPCAAGGPDRRLRYDAAAAAPFASAPIPAGSSLGRLRLPRQAPVPAGQTMRLRTRVGPVVIERDVTALQPGQPGKRLFVRTEDGKLLASRLAAEASEVPE